MPEQNRELKNRVREIRSHGSVRGQGRNGLALLGRMAIDESTLKLTWLGGTVNALFNWAYLRSRRSYFAAGAYPSEIFLELTSVCNLKCPMCPHKTMKRKAGHLETGLAEKLAKELSQHHPMLRQLGLHGFGEALLHPELGTILSMLRRRLPTTRLSVGVNLASARAEQIDVMFDNGITEIGVWIDSIREETYEVQRAGAKLKKTLEAVEYVLERKRRSESAYPLFHIGMILTRLNEGQIEEFVRFWRERLRGVRGVGLYSTRAHNFAGEMCEEDLLLRPRSRYYVNRPCSMPFQQVLILSSGEICFCCYDVEGETSAGNLREMTLGEAWRSEKARRFREEAARTEFRAGLCKRCEVKRFHLLDGRPKPTEYISYRETF